MSHLDGEGRPRMVDVSGKQESARRAVAEGYLEAGEDGARAAAAGTGAKGSVLAVAQLAAIMAAKRTADIIPLCHPLRIGKIDAQVDVAGTRIRVRVEVAGWERTGFEMEALTAVSAGLLAAYDMLKYLGKDMTIGPVRLLEKSGGKSGDYQWRES